MTSLKKRAPVASEAAQLMGTRILVVEDSWEVSAGLKMLLSSYGAEVIGPAATSDEAKRLMCEHTPDVALVDINLRNGEQSYSLIDEMRVLGVPIILITGYADTSAASHRADAILCKPFSDKDLLATLRALKVTEAKPARSGH
jgi:DNA-binding response OmpR family regulator